MMSVLSNSAPCLGGVGIGCAKAAIAQTPQKASVKRRIFRADGVGLIKQMTAWIMCAIEHPLGALCHPVMSIDEAVVVTFASQSPHTHGSRVAQLSRLFGASAANCRVPLATETFSPS